MVNKKKFEEEEAAGYRIEVLGRNLEVTEPIRAYVWNKISKIERFHNHIMYIHLTLEIQKMEHTCTIVAKFDHFKVKVQASSTDMYVTIDYAIDRLQNILSRYKDRIHDHRKREPEVIDMKVSVLQRPKDEIAEINDEIIAANQESELALYQPHKIVGTEKKPLKTLNVQEAAMKMDLSGDPFLIYRSEEDRKLKVIYRRKDGNYGILEPELTSV